MSSSKGKKHVLRMREARKDFMGYDTPLVLDIQGRLMKED